MVAALAACAGTASPAASSGSSVGSMVSSSDTRPSAGAGYEATSAAASSSRTDDSSPANSGTPSPATSLVAAPTTLRGTIIDNDRPTCRVLQTDTGRWALVGPGVDTVRVGDTVTVTGAAQPHLIGLCGRSFVVTSVHH